MNSKSRFLPAVIGIACAALLASPALSGDGQNSAQAAIGLTAAKHGASAGLLSVLAVLAILASLLLVRRNRNSMARLNAQKDQAQAALNALPDAIIQLDSAGGLSFLNPAAEAMLGLRPGTGGADLKAPWQFIDHETRSPLLEALLARVDKEGPVRIPAGARLINRHGLELEVEGVCQPLPDSLGRIDRYLLQLRDVSEESEWRRQQPDLWDRDPVSSLPGRSFMENRLNRALQNRRAADRPMTYLAVSFSGIRAVYDEVGSVAGDALIRHLTALLRAHVRDTDLVARMDEESFAVLLTICPAEIGQRIAGALHGALDSFNFEWENRAHPIRGTLAQVDIPPFDGSVDELLAAARPHAQP